MRVCICVRVRVRVRVCVCVCVSLLLILLLVVLFKVILFIELLLDKFEKELRVLDDFAQFRVVASF